MELYSTKLKKCGNIVKIHKYKIPVKIGYKSKRGNSKHNPNITDEERKLRRKNKMNKSKYEFIDIVNYNFTTNDVFITLTNEREEDPATIKYNFNNFIKKIKYRFGKDIKYCYVKHKQKRGVYHYHMVADIEYIQKDVLEKIWPYGISSISKINNVNAVAVYMANHVDDTVIEKKEYRSKIFQTSKTCKRPKWIYGAEAENILAKMSNDFNETFAKTYSTKMYSNMDIKIYEK